jgi:DNA-binding GntR family transcriptional regulator
MAKLVSTVEPIQRIQLHDEALKKLSGQILRGELEPGSRVQERELCEQLGISRTPLREALKVLAARGLVELRPNRGALIAPLRAVDVDEAFDVLSLLERRAGELATPRLDDAAIQHLAGLHAAMIELSRGPDSEAMLRLDLQIHRMIVEATGNRTLMTVHEGLTIKVERARYLAATSLERVRSSMQEHEIIMAAVTTRDPIAVSRALYAHCVKTRAATVAAVLARSREHNASEAA